MTTEIEKTKPPLVADADTALAETAQRRRRMDHDHPFYKWIVLSNTTLGMLLAAINASIVLISLPAIFRGIGLNPLAPANVSYLLWMLMGYLVVTAVLVVFFGRLGDMYRPGPDLQPRIRRLHRSRRSRCPSIRSTSAAARCG